MVFSKFLQSLVTIKLSCYTGLYVNVKFRLVNGSILSAGFFGKSIAGVGDTYLIKTRTVRTITLLEKLFSFTAKLTEWLRDRNGLSRITQCSGSGYG